MLRVARPGKKPPERAGGEAAGWRPSPTPLLAAGWGLLLCAWAFGNPPFAAPDEGAHFVRTAGVAEGTLVGREPAGPVTPLVVYPTARRTAWVAQTTREVAIPRRLGGGRGADCFVVDRTRSAACAVSPPPVAPEEGTVSAISTVGTYQPLPYLLPAVATIPARNGDDADRLARLALAATALALLALAAAMLWDAGAGGLSLLGLAVAVSPMVIFSGATLNGSGLEIAAGVAFAAALLRVWRDSGGSALGWAGTGAAGAVLALSRSTGPIWVALLAGGWLALLGPRAAVAAARSRPGAAWAGGAVLVALVANRVWEAGYGARPPVSLRAARAGLTTGLEQVGFAADEVVGQFGYLEWRLPIALLLLGAAAVAGMHVAAFAVAGRRERIALLGALAGAVLVPLGLWVLFLRHTGFGLQGRHVLPLLVAVPLLGGEILVRARDRLTARARAALCVATAGAVAVVHFGAWWYNARRAATGTDGPLLFLPDAEWSPPLGWTPWLLIAAVGAALVVAAIAGPGARPAGERRQPA